MSDTELNRTPLHPRHVDAGARLVPFAGFEMPVKYTSEKAEHLAVRNAVGLFDVSHMGEVSIEGPDALAACQLLFANDVGRIVDGQAMYTGLLTERGTFVDDAIVYRFTATRFLVVTNASNHDKDFAHMRDAVAAAYGADQVEVRDVASSWAQLAVQGPRGPEVVAAIAGRGVLDLKPFRFVEGEVEIAGGAAPALIARTGYTGEDGFELYVPAEHALAVWDAVVAAGAAHELALCGLACRDTLRLEAGLALYGNDIDDSVTPLEAGLAWTVKLEREGPSFIGADALRKQKAEGIKRQLRGLEMEGRGIPRAGYPVLTPDGQAIGEVKSGTQAPFLNRPVAMAYVDAEHASPETKVAVEIRGKPVPARVVKLPFYKRDPNRTGAPT